MPAMPAAKFTRNLTMQAKPIPIPETRAVVRLLGDVAMRHAPPRVRRNVLMQNLGDMVDADAWLWLTATRNGRGYDASSHVVFKGGSDGLHPATFCAAGARPDIAALVDLLFRKLPRTDSHLTLTREELDSEASFVRSGDESFWQEIRLAPVMLSAMRASPARLSLLGLYRRTDRSGLAEGEALIAHTVLSEVPDLHREGFPSEIAPAVDALSPRLRQVLDCLLQGRSRKEIANDLGLSTHTVGGYVAELYQRFQAHSQADLVCKIRC